MQIKHVVLDQALGAKSVLVNNMYICASLQYLPAPSVGGTTSSPALTLLALLTAALRPLSSQHVGTAVSVHGTLHGLSSPAHSSKFSCFQGIRGAERQQLSSSGYRQTSLVTVQPTLAEVTQVLPDPVHRGPH